MDYTFTTPGPIHLDVEIGSGDIQVTATDTDTTTIEVTGELADQVKVEQDGRTIAVTMPKLTMSFGRRHQVDVVARIPAGSDLSTLVGSADLVTHGALASCRLKSGSGELRLEQIGSGDVIAGSGDLSIERVGGDLRAKSGSGDVSLREVSGSADITTGSGDMQVGTVSGSLSTKTGSGEVRVGQAGGQVTITAASGDVVVDQASAGTVTVRSASGDIAVGAAAGLPVWTDLNTISGHIDSRLVPLGQPAEGDPFLELRLRTVSGDIRVWHHDAAAGWGTAPDSASDPARPDLSSGDLSAGDLSSHQSSSNQHGGPDQHTA